MLFSLPIYSGNERQISMANLKKEARSTIGQLGKKKKPLSHLQVSVFKCFGPFGHPNYNSVATFGHKMARNRNAHN
jgi:hypothetical protein